MEQVITEKKRRVGRPKTVYKKCGRKPLLDARMIIEISKFMGEGYTINDTCIMVNISRTALFNWLQDAEEDIAIGKHSLKVELHNAIKKAEIDYKHKLQENIRIAGLDPSKWQANAWLLERKYASEFGKNEITIAPIMSEDTIKKTYQAIIGYTPSSIKEDEE